MRTTVAALSVATLLTACATNRPTTDTAASASKIEVSEDTSGCSVYVYRNRTMFERGNPEKPFLYVGEEKIGRLGIGDSVCLKMPDGKYTISVKGSIAFMPSFTVGQVDVDVVAGAPVYVRYAKQFGGVAPAGANTTTVGRSSVQIATQAQWLERQ